MSVLNRSSDTGTQVTGRRAAPREPADDLASPPAVRAPRRSWPDPRLLVGVAVVAASVLVGARVLATADDAVSVWALASDVPAGASLRPEDLERVDVRFGSPDLAERYVAASSRLPSGSVVSRGLGSGELLPRAALRLRREGTLLEVPVAAPADAVPVTLRAGEVVDVWVAPREREAAADGALPVLRGVRVVAAPPGAGALGPSVTRQVVVGVPKSDEHLLPEALAQLSLGSAVLVRRR